ncbi:hypothetical protein [Bdellovibrio sp. HCB337]|uniref:hypothetical protein n=1 Tax=Bdellovibrio sp. HCB337 TaxID=3394358 RepID=UPI0039A5CEBD
MRMHIFRFIIVTAFLGMTSAKAAVWQETQSWDSSWEKKYSEWVRNSFNEEIFVSGPYKDISTDCSDAVYAARVIFAYEHKLPFVIRDSTGGGSRITNKMSRFDDISDSLKRVRKFIVFVGQATSTKTLPDDTYPVKINREYVRAGTVWTRPRQNAASIIDRIVRGGAGQDPGHAELVKSVSDTGVIYLIGSTVPKAVRQMHTTSSLVFMPVETTTGLRNWIPADYYGRSKSSIPGYSLEQYNTLGSEGGDSRHIRTWTRDVQKRLALREESKEESIERQADDVCGLVNARVDIVADGEERRRHLDGACMDQGDYEAYSTPSRDNRIKESLFQIMDAANAKGFTKTQKLKKLKSYLDRCPDIRISSGRTISLYEFALQLMKGNVSNNPNHNFEARWGLGRDITICRKY